MQEIYQKGENHHLRQHPRTGMWHLKVKVKKPGAAPSVKGETRNFTLKTKCVEVARRRRDRVMAAMDAAGYLSKSPWGKGVTGVKANDSFRELG